MTQHRIFKPVILFHDHSYSTDPSGVTHRIHIPYGDPYYIPLIQQKKQTVGMMLKSNGKAWYDIIQSTRQELSPKPTQSPKLSKKPKKTRRPNNKSNLFSDDDDDDAISEEEDFHLTSSSSSSSSSDSSCCCESEDHPIKSPLPSSSSALNNTNMIRKRRGNLPKTVTAVLKQWLVEHCRNPYPTEAEKIGLKDKTGLTLNQISNWFINARRRLLPQILDDVNHKGTDHVLLVEGEMIEDDPIPR
ncbi:homeobox KN domain-containing protein [Gilbertella persicaria]|uniref:homeobox KN domain-containing protein n=1 Tax=Gilbertella persicaria TaxID=101096 RepID=UPI00221EFEED|nr:homeobox KN domain-containing protein [Gilbertella persicaria]KAI8097983.1 homeobox KN domain-containing protein [Gilbertella persicaria]